MLGKAFADEGVRRTRYARRVSGIAERIREILTSQGISERELARRAHLKSEAHVGLLLAKLQKDPEAVELRTLKAIAAGAGVSESWLISGVGDAPSPVRTVELTPRYQNIEAAIAYHPGRWRPETIAAGRGMARDGEEDRPPKEWEELLDRLEAAIRGKGSIGTLVEDDEDPPPRARKPKAKP